MRVALSYMFIKMCRWQIVTKFPHNSWFSRLPGAPWLKAKQHIVKWSLTLFSIEIKAKRLRFLFLNPNHFFHAKMSWWCSVGGLEGTWQVLVQVGSPYRNPAQDTNHVRGRVRVVGAAGHIDPGSIRQWQSIAKPASFSCDCGTCVFEPKRPKTPKKTTRASGEATSVFTSPFQRSCCWIIHKPPAKWINYVCK